MIAIYLLGCLASIITILIILFCFRKEIGIITAKDIMYMLLFIIISWIFVLLTGISLLLWLFDELDDKLDNIIIWKKKK